MIDPSRGGLKDVLSCWWTEGNPHGAAVPDLCRLVIRGGEGGEEEEREGWVLGLKENPFSIGIIT